MRSFGFFLKETIDGIRRHGTGSLVTFIQVFGSLFVLGLCLIIILNLNHLGWMFLNNLEMGVFLSEELTYDQADDLKNIVTEMPGVREVEYISKEMAFAIMQERTSMDISDLVQSNPLPASLKVTVTSPRAAQELAQKIVLLKGVDDVRYGEDQLQSLLPLFYGLEVVIFFSLIIAAAATLVTITNTIRLAILARKKEIKIMQLVGATSMFIRIPFMFEGLFYGIAGAALALILIAITYGILLKVIVEQNPLTWLIGFSLMMNNLSLMIFVLGGCIGIIASLIAVGKHLEDDFHKPIIVRQGGYSQ